MSFLEIVRDARLRRVEEAQERLSVDHLWLGCGLLEPARDICELRRSWPAERRAIVAEVKRRSPSAGDLRPGADAAGIAKAYAEAGAFAVSVLREPDFFGGSLADLAAVRRAVDLPVLYKDFVVDPYQVWEARSCGADLILLMVSLLGPSIGAYLRLAREAGIEALVEVHDEEELEAALGAGARAVGVNNRNLETLQVDLEVSRRLLPRIPEGVMAVAESGLKEPSDLDELAGLGAAAFLVGGALMSAPEPGAALAELVGGGA